MSLKIASRLAVALIGSASLVGDVCARGGGYRNDPTSEWQQSGDTIDVSDNHGGSVAQYDILWAELAAQGKKVRVVGNCQSACTTLLGHIARARICVTPEASFGFHLARQSAMSDVMWSGYPSDIKRWIQQQGGLTADFKWMRAPDIYRFFKPC